MSDYIPRNDAAALQWFLNYSQKLSANPGLYLVTPADALAVAQAVDDFEVALAAIGTPETKRNPVLIVAKDDARTAAEQICRQIGIQVKYSAAISDADKIALGIRPVNPNRDPIPVPVSSPVLSVFAAGVLTHTVRFADAYTPDSKSKPYGVKQLQLYVHVGDAIEPDPEAMKFHGLHTKSPIGIAFGSDEVGKKATYRARWCTITGLVGPWSAEAHMSIAA